MSADANTCAECLADLSGGGCHYRYGNDAECPLPKRADTPAQAIGRAILADLCGRRGIKNGIEGCDYEILAEIRQTLGEIALRTAAPTWLPIETVPRDGTSVIVCIAGVDRSQGEAYWWQDAAGRGGWQTWDGANHKRTVYVTPPTHWMPLPEVPGGDL